MDYTFSFESLGAFLDAANGPRVRYGKGGSCDSRTGTYAFTHSESYEQSCLLAINGCPEIEARIAHKVAELNLSGHAMNRPECVWDVSGQGVDVVRYLSGEPECMIDYEMHEKDGGRIVHVLANISASASVQASTFERRGAALCCIIDACENAGYRVEITAGMSTRGGGNTAETRVTIKNAQEPLDMARVAYALAHPSMIRRTYFSFCETAGSKLVAANLGPANGYGSPCEMTGDLGDVYLGIKDWHKFESDRSTEAWLRETLAKLGVCED